MTSAPAPGWYQDPGGLPGTQRWWDGGTWSHVTRPAPPGATPSYAAPVKMVATPDGVPLAGLGARLVALLLDNLLISIVAIVVALPYLGQMVDAVSRWEDRVITATQNGTTVSPFDLYSDPDFLRAYAVLFVVTVALNLVYTVVLIRVRGATLGKMVTGVRVRPWVVEALPSWRQSFLRWLTSQGIALVPFIGGIYLLIDYLWPIGDPRKQALHDKLPATIVVKARLPGAF